MTDEPEVESIQLTRSVSLSVERWPERTAFSEVWLRLPHVDGATVDGDKVRISVENGWAVYTLRRDLPPHGRGIVAELVDSHLDGARKVKAGAPKKAKAR